MSAPANIFSISTFDSDAITTQRKEQTYFAHTIPEPANGVHEVAGQVITDSYLAAWITAHPITGFVVTGDDVQLPDWRGRYLGGSGGDGISGTAGELLDSENKAHTHTYTRRENLYVAGNSSNWANTQNGVSTRTTGSSGGTYARPQTVGIPLCIIVGQVQDYVLKSAVVVATNGSGTAGQTLVSNGDGTSTWQ